MNGLVTEVVVGAPLPCAGSARLVCAFAAVLFGILLDAWFLVALEATHQPGLVGARGDILFRQAPCSPVVGIYTSEDNMMYGRLRSFKNRLDVYIRFNRYRRKFAEDLSFTGAATRFPVRDELHAYMHHYFRHLAPQEIRDHRAYYRKEMRGFGEAALHAMWFTLLREFKPAQCLEIGVYRGQVVTLWGIIARQRGFPCELHGISPFSPAGDDVSAYLANLDYEQDVLASCARFGLPDPTFVKGFSTEPAALEHIASRAWDLIYVDGNHDYEVVIADYQACRDALRPGGILIMDDSSVGTDFHPPSFSFAGHPGPSRVVQEYAMKEMRFLGGVAHNNVFQKP